MKKHNRCRTCGKYIGALGPLCADCYRIKIVSDSNRPEGYGIPDLLDEGGSF